MGLLFGVFVTGMAIAMAFGGFHARFWLNFKGSRVDFGSILGFGNRFGRIFGMILKLEMAKKNNFRKKSNSIKKIHLSFLNGDPRAASLRLAKRRNARGSPTPQHVGSVLHGRSSPW